MSLHVTFHNFGIAVTQLVAIIVPYSRFLITASNCMPIPQYFSSWLLVDIRMDIALA